MSEEIDASGVETSLTVEQCRSITINPPRGTADPWLLVPALAEHFDRYRYVIGREKCKGGKHHIECCVVAHTDTKHFARDLEGVIGMPIKKPAVLHRAHTGEMALVKLGYAQKENNFVTNIDDLDLLARAREALAAHQSQQSMTSVCTASTARLQTFDKFPIGKNEMLTEYLKRVEPSRKCELAGQFAAGQITFEQAIKLGCTPSMMQFVQHRRTRVVVESGGGSEIPQIPQPSDI